MPSRDPSRTEPITTLAMTARGPVSQKMGITSQHQPSLVVPSEETQCSYLSMTDRSSSTDHTQQQHPAYLLELTSQVTHNLRHQHDWTSLTLHTHSPLAPHALLPRPLISGLPPTRIYIHPDEQVELLKRRDKAAETRAEREWVLPTKLREQWTLRQLAEVFDSVGEQPPEPSDDGSQEVQTGELQGNGETQTPASRRPIRKREKRLLLATAGDDSTIVYYIIHDGIVKPRQN